MERVFPGGIQRSGNVSKCTFLSLDTAEGRKLLFRFFGFFLYIWMHLAISRDSLLTCVGLVEVSPTLERLVPTVRDTCRVKTLC